MKYIGAWTFSIKNVNFKFIKISEKSCKILTYGVCTVRQINVTSDLSDAHREKYWHCKQRITRKHTRIHTIRKSERRSKRDIILYKFIYIHIYADGLHAQWASANAGKTNIYRIAGICGRETMVNSCYAIPCTQSAYDDLLWPMRNRFIKKGTPFRMVQYRLYWFFTICTCFLTWKRFPSGTKWSGPYMSAIEFAKLILHSRKRKRK